MCQCLIDFIYHFSVQQIVPLDGTEMPDNTEISDPDYTEDEEYNSRKKIPKKREKKATISKRKNATDGDEGESMKEGGDVCDDGKKVKRVRKVCYFYLNVTLLQLDGYCYMFT